MEKPRVASVSSLQSALHSAAKKHEKDFCFEKSGEFAQRVENLSNHYDPTVGRKYMSKVRGLCLKIRNVDFDILVRILNGSLTVGQFLSGGGGVVSKLIH
jgi:hypothetical protein